MKEKFTIKEIELIQLAMEYLDSELPEYDSVHTKLRAMQKAQDNSEICLQTQFIRSDGVKCWLSNHLPCDEWSEGGVPFVAGWEGVVVRKRENLGNQTLEAGHD